MQQILRISHAVLPEAGEDSFALRSEEQGAFLCVTDGCGGLGSKRYASLDNRTGAYMASRLAARAFADWAQNGYPVPETDEEAQKLCGELEDKLFRCLKEFAEANISEEKSRIVGSMQRCLPTALCALTAQHEDLCFWWAGDSRGYVMDAEGLHQYTKDDVRGERDAFEALYQDAPLSNLLSADKAGSIRFRRVHMDGPGIALAATDGVYSSLPTPMEVEMLLLDTLKTARCYADWERKLLRQIERNAQDDATLLLIPFGFENFVQLRELLLPRREVLQKQMITPVRRRKGDIAFAREKWLQYKQTYDRTEGGHE